MILVGITGGIGMGKSAAAGLLNSRGLPVIDTDTIARQLVQAGQPALHEIRSAFGEEMIDPDGSLRRDRLAGKVFANPGARQQLESILHPRIREVWQAQAKQWEADGQQIGFVIIPLLFETNAESSFGAIICIACTEESQRCRLRQRGWNDEQVAQRIAAQWPIGRKMERSDYVIWTETSLDVHAAQLEHVIAQIQNRATVSEGPVRNA